MRQRIKNILAVLSFAKICAILLMLLVSCHKNDLVLDGQLAGASYNRIISTSVAGDTLLVDLLLPEEAARVIGLSRSFSSYGLEGAQHIIDEYMIPKDFDLNALESLFFYQPDLVIASRWAIQSEYEEIFHKFQVKLHILDVPTTLKEIYDQLDELAQLLGGVALEHAQRLNVQLAEVHRLLSRRAELSSLAALRVLDVNSSGSTAGEHTTLNLVIELAGLENLGKSLSEASPYGYAPLSEEMILLLDPEVIIADSIMAERLRSQPVFRQLQAVANGFIFEIDEKRQRLFYSATHHLMFASMQFQEQVLHWLNYL